MKRALAVILPALAGWLIGSVIWACLFLLSKNVNLGPGGSWANGIVLAGIAVGLVIGIRAARRMK